MDSALNHVGSAAAEGHDAQKQGEQDHHHIRVLDPEHDLMPGQSADQNDRGHRQADRGQH